LFVTDSINLFSEHLTNETLEEFGDSKIGQAVRAMKYVDDLMLLAKGKMALQSMTDKTN
jgi:hypothetical protein